MHLVPGLEAIRIGSRQPTFHSAAEKT